MYVCGGVVLKGYCVGTSGGPGVCNLAEFLRRWSRSSGSSSGAVVVVVEEEEVAVVFVSGERRVNGRVEGCGFEFEMAQAEWAGRSRLAK